MLLKLEAPVIGQQPNIAAGGLATMTVQPGPRVGILYAKLSVTKAAGGSGVTSLPVLSDVADPGRDQLVKIGGKVQFQRRALENADDNARQSADAKGSVTYWQAGVKVATAFDVRNTVAPSGLATNTATTAVFQVPIYFMQPWRKSPIDAEIYGLPTKFSDNSTLPVLSIEVPITPAAGGFSGHNCQFWMSYDNATPSPINGQPLPLFLKKGRVQETYSTTGDFTVPVDVIGQLQQFSLILASGDTWSKILIKKNSIILRQVNNEDNAESLHAYGLQVSQLTENRVDIVFDLNDTSTTLLAGALPIGVSDTFEVTVTLATVAAAAQMAILTEVYGQPN